MGGTQGPDAGLPQLSGRRFVTDGGMETDLIFHHDVDLSLFAAFPLLETAAGRAMLEAYYDGYAAIARQAGAGLMLEAPTWRANPDWGDLLGYGAPELADINQAAIVFLGQLRERYADTVTDILVSGLVGPRYDGYHPGLVDDPGTAEAYHGPQIEAFARAGADQITALTLADPGEATGITRAARAAGLPVAISFTVETDGRLPSGISLAEAIEAVDRAAAPDYFLVNCAHPLHIEPALAEAGDWRARIAGLRCNASTRSHAELDDADELDEGDLQLLAESHRRLEALLPRLSIVGGCCGTDARHVAALWNLG
ncbi:MAG: homocysteine S-methyltransferase family protein [Actinomycetota bacterium]